MDTITLPYDTDAVLEWDAPQCLRFLAEHARQQGENYHNLLNRSHNWDAEVERFADYEGVPEDEWNDEATEELRSAVLAIMEPANNLAYARTVGGENPFGL